MTNQYRAIFLRPGSKVVFSAVTMFRQLLGTERKRLIENDQKCQLISYTCTTESLAITGERYHMLGKHHYNRSRL